ncbi:uncharacterized protein LOC126689407 [Quercus robur]|uniref:uncharacterized protein LOC126689407 n=1 Tax=Quercus robur TaxID=38942 RepID=UPI0021629451|nr:uncharacterized protein LOC126689407 [Quercus robur]
MAFKFLQNHPILALILALLFAHEILCTAFAASGGRMGGSSFASDKESSSYLSSKSYNIYHYDNYPRFSSGYVDDDIDSLRVNEKHEGTSVWFFILPFGSFVGIFLLIAYLNRASVLRVQVGFSGIAHSIQRELSTLATAVDTSKNKSFHFFLTESAVALLRHRNYWISGYSSVERRWNLEAVEKEFRQLSTDERLKYDIESLVNVDNMKVQRTFIPRNNKVEKNFIVVTILVAVKGALNLPEIKSTEDLRTALNYLNTISSSNTLAVEVLWSPQAEHDTLSEDELLENYPLLRPI